MAEQPSPDDAMFARFFSGESDAPERAYVERWIAADPSRGPLAEHLRTIWGRAVDADQAFDLPGIWRRLAHELSPGVDRPALALRTALAPRTGPRGVGGVSRFLPFAALSASVIVLFALGRAAGTYRRRPSLPMAGHEYRAAAGRRETVTLPDGTQLILAPASTVRVPPAYGQSTREVTLDGEAYFSVVHDTRHPFAIRTGHAVATDIGTRFDVRFYPGDTVVRVVVADGQVSLAASNGGTPIALVAADFATVSRSGATTVAHGADVTALTAWTAGRLEFYDTPLRDVLAEIARWYAVDIHLAEPTLGNRLVRGTYADDAFEHVLTLVTSAVGARYERHGRTFVVVADPAVSR